MKANGEKSGREVTYDGSGSGSNGRQGARQRSVKGAAEGDRGESRTDSMDKEAAEAAEDRGVK